MNGRRHTIPLRAHHLLCLRGFQGYGYSDGFAAHLGGIVEALKNGDPLVRVAAGADEVCRKCPQLRDGVCVDELDVAARDAAALRAIGASAGEVASWSAWGKRVADKAARERLVGGVCAECRWHSVCLWFLGTSER